MTPHLQFRPALQLAACPHGRAASWQTRAAEPLPDVPPSPALHLLPCAAEKSQLLCFCLHLSLSPALPLTRTGSPALCCRDAADAEQQASQLATSAASALQSARSSAALLTGRQGEVEPTDLEELAASRLDAWLNEHPGADSFQASGSLTSRGSDSSAVPRAMRNTSQPEHARP